MPIKYISIKDNVCALIFKQNTWCSVISVWLIKVFKNYVHLVEMIATICSTYDTTMRGVAAEGAVVNDKKQP